jgi:hypothetical protein
VTWLDYIRTLWPLAVVLTPLVTGAGILWLKTQFPTKKDLQDVETKILREIEGHDERLGAGSAKMADFDKRIALVEQECDATPTKGEVNQSIATLAGRMSGVESSLRGVERILATQHDYLRTLVDRGLGQ